MQQAYDVFVSYHHGDAQAVRAIALKLRDRGIKVWLDEWELPPGQPWVPAMEEALDRSGSVAVFVGPHGMGTWSEREFLVALDQHVYEGKPVIPVRLPGTRPDMKLRPSLQNNTWVEFTDTDDGTALDRLVWGITGRRPESEATNAPPRTPPTVPFDPLDGALELLTGYLGSGNVTYYVGSGAVAGAGTFSQRYQIARQLLAGVDLSSGAQTLLPPIDVVSLYFSLRHTSRALEDKLFDLMVSSPVEPPVALASLARLLRLLGRRPVRRRRYSAPQLIITTNIDLSLERALLREGISFARVVQHRSGGRAHVNDYANVRIGEDGLSLDGPAASAPIPLENTEAIDEAIRASGRSQLDGRAAIEAFTLDAIGKPIVYKFMGSLDIPDSCVVSTDQYLDLLWRTQRERLIPPAVADVVANSPSLFIGYGWLDPDFRLVYQAMLREAFQMNADQTVLRYALQAAPQAGGDPDDAYRQVEARLWNSLRVIAPQQTKITILETPASAFLASLSKRVEAMQHPA